MVSGALLKITCTETKKHNPTGGFMTEIKKIGDLYTDFVRIDLDARGGYSRVAQTKIVNRPDIPEYCAFKIMRHELQNHQKGMDRFEVELQTLAKIFKDENYPSAITKIYDSGFVDPRVSKGLQKPNNVIENTHRVEKIDPEWEIISTGVDLNAFLEVKASIKGNTAQWLPYIVVELVPYNNSLLRQIHEYGNDPIAHPHIFPVGEVVMMALQLLDVIEYLQQHELTYMNWQPNHIYWDSRTQQVKLNDWAGVKILQDNEKRTNIIREDIRLFCGAVLYCSMALSDPEDMQRPIGPAPRLDRSSLSSSLRRYWTDEPNFYERGPLFDDHIKQLIKTGLDPNQGFDTPSELKIALRKYTEKNLNLPGTIQSNTQSLIGGIPRDAAQHYRRARSYISAGDLQLALASLRQAVKTAEELGVEFSDAMMVLKTVEIRFNSDELKQEARKAIKNKDWEAALDFYNKALKQDPTNIFTDRDVSFIQDATIPLTNAIQSAKQRGVKYPDAEKLLEAAINKLPPDSLESQVRIAFKNKDWKNVWNLYNRELLLHPQSREILGIIDGIDAILRAKTMLDSLAAKSVTQKERTDKLEKIDQFLKEAEKIENILANTELLKTNRNRYNHLMGLTSKNAVYPLRNWIILAIVILILFGVIYFLFGNIYR